MQSISLYPMPKGKPSLAERVKIVMEAEGWTQSELARKAETNRQTVNNWLNNPSYEHMDADFAFNVSEKSTSRFNPRWLYSGDGPERLPAGPTQEERSLLDAIRALSGKRRGALATFLET